MPYIKTERRWDLDNGDHPETAGELNYVITRLVIEFADTNVSYDTYNTVIGVLESAKLEFYRRAVAEYEEIKVAENGDVY